MIKAVQIENTGGPEVMHLVSVDLAKPAPGEVRIRQTAIGLNYIDTYHRSGLYPVKLPSGLGLDMQTGNPDFSEFCRAVPQRLPWNY